MKRIDNSTATDSDKFTDGDPSVPTPATIVEAEWLNVIQEELAYVVEQASITLDQTGADTTQLYDAIVSIINSLASAGVTLLDEDDMSSDSATDGATQQSIKAYVDNEIAAIPTPPTPVDGVGIGQTWQDVKASRAGNTSYQNTTGQPIMVEVSQPNVNGNFQVSTNGSSWVNVAYASGGGNIASGSFIVPNGHYYRHNAGSSSYNTWSELR